MKMKFYFVKDEGRFKEEGKKDETKGGKDETGGGKEETEREKEGKKEQIRVKILY